MVVAFVLGLGGSLGHCVGMCGGIGLLLGRGARSGPTRVVRLSLVHAGRITSYAVLGAAAGLVGAALLAAVPGVRRVQGALALAGAGLALYTAAAFLGRVPGPDRLLGGLTRRWGRAMGEAMASSAAVPYLVGMLWGYLPCGLVLLALTGAAATGSAAAGAGFMAAFGLGTVPTLVALGLFAPRGSGRRVARGWALAASAVVAVFGLQMALRGLAAWGIVDHLLVGPVVLW